MRSLVGLSWAFPKPYYLSKQARNFSLVLIIFFKDFHVKTILNSPKSASLNSDIDGFMAAGFSGRR